MENNLEIGNPKIPTPDGLPKKNELKTLAYLCAGVAAGLLIYHLFIKDKLNENEERDTKRTY